MFKKEAVNDQFYHIHNFSLLPSYCAPCFSVTHTVCVCVCPEEPVSLPTPSLVCEFQVFSLHCHRYLFVFFARKQQVASFYGYHSLINRLFVFFLLPYLHHSIYLPYHYHIFVLTFFFLRFIVTIAIVVNNKSQYYVFTDIFIIFSETKIQQNNEETQ